jgi:uncharacterized protein DUF3147
VRVRLNYGALRQTRWYEYGIRFLFGGVITALAAVVAELWGPSIGGLLLAFPAIFPASATLLERHEREKKHRAGMHGAKRGREAAGLDAAGAALGSFGLIAFALANWKLLTIWNPWLVLVIATVSWFVTSVLLWRLRKAF